MVKAAAVVAGYAISGLCGYLYGHHVGFNEPKLDKHAIEKAIFLAISEK
jgi:hypothetical protein